MGKSSLLRSPKKEEQEEVPDSLVPIFLENNHTCTEVDKETYIMDDLEGILGIKDEENFLLENKINGHLNWEYSFMDWDGFSFEEEEEIEEDKKVSNTSLCFQEDSFYNCVKSENYGFWVIDDNKKKNMSLKLSLNYQEVLDAWSGRGSLLADDCSLSMANNKYMGEVPVMEEERTRREASVLRYKVKRQSRLFSNKIRYQVRKLNADTRPRLKGRFVKRVIEKKPK